MGSVATGGASVAEEFDSRSVWSSRRPRSETSTRARTRSRADASARSARGIRAARPIPLDLKSSRRAVGIQAQTAFAPARPRTIDTGRSDCRAVRDGSIVTDARVDFTSASSAFTSDRRAAFICRGASRRGRTARRRRSSPARRGPKAGPRGRRRGDRRSDSRASAWRCGTRRARIRRARPRSAV